MAATSAGPEDVVVVRNVDVEAFLCSQDHQHDLIRELKLIDLGDRFRLTSEAVPAELGLLIESILTRYAEVRSVTRDQALAARRRGEATVDLSVPVRPGMRLALREWLSLLEEADDMCERGELLTVPPPEAVRQLRRWYVDALVSVLPNLEAEDSDVGAGGPGVEVDVAVLPVPLPGERERSNSGRAPTDQ